MRAFEFFCGREQNCNLMVSYIYATLHVRENIGINYARSFTDFR